MIPRKMRYRDDLLRLDTRQLAVLAAASATRAASVYDYFAAESERAVLRPSVEALWSPEPLGPASARAALERLDAIWPYRDDTEEDDATDEPEYGPDEPRYWKIRALEVPRFALIDLAEGDPLNAADSVIEYGIGLIQSAEGAIGAEPLRGLTDQYADSPGPFEELEGDLLDESLAIVVNEPPAEALSRLRERSEVHGRRVRETLLPVLATVYGWSQGDIEEARG